MLAEKYRLRKDTDIRNTLKKGKIYFSPFFNMKILKNELNNPRFCIVVSTTISKKAVTRNKVKRQLRSIIQKNLENIDKNYDIVILTKPEITVTTFTDIEKDYQSIIKKAKI